jgi:hypothetical protein
MNNQGMSMAAALSFHPNQKLKADPRYQRNNPLNAAGFMPGQQVSGTIYGDAQVERPTAGITINPAAQQQIVLRPSGSMPGGDNPVVPGHPGQIGRTQDLQQLDNPLLTTTTVLGESQRRPMGSGREAIDRGIPGQLAMGGAQRPTGFSTSAKVGGRRPLMG